MPPTLEPREKKGKQGDGITSLAFKEDSLAVKFRRAWRKAICTSLVDDTDMPGTSVGSSDGEQRQSVAYKDALRDIEKEESSDWATDLTLLDGDIEATQGGSQTGVHPRNSDLEAQRSGSEHQAPPSRSLREELPLISRYGWSQSLALSVINFFDPCFADEEMEKIYQKERWANHKPIAVATSLFLVLNWVLYLVFNRVTTLYETIVFYGLATLFTLPVPFAMIFNISRRPGIGKIAFQILVMITTFFWGMAETIEIRECKFFPTRSACSEGKKDFLFAMAYSIGLPALGLFACSLQRLYFTIGAAIQFILLCTIILPYQAQFVRNALSYCAFMAFWCFLHYWQESTDRRTYILRCQLKIALKAQQKAQVAQKQAASSKKRFVSYIFHEVRVPLNSAMLAFQNLAEHGVFERAQHDQTVEVHALEGSMSAVKQVLDDVLDLQRMDSGKFEAIKEPFAFHTSIMAILSSMRVGAAAKGLDFFTDIDSAIDLPAPQLQQSDQLYVMGDALRLRQVLQNLTSNAVKFCETGSVTVRTKLIKGLGTGAVERGATLGVGAVECEAEVAPRASSESRPPMARSKSLKAFLPELKARNSDGTLVTSTDNSIVIRIEVSDTGVGIKPSESARLFSPFFQTRLGAMQAGKGSGLGLAIVRQIVALSGGRLGVQSRKGQGACFWFELPFEVATLEDVEASRSMRTHHVPLLHSTVPRTPRLSFAPAVSTAPSGVHFSPARPEEVLVNAILTNSTRPMVTTTQLPMTASYQAEVVSDAQQESKPPFMPTVKAQSFSGPHSDAGAELNPMPATPEEPLQVLVVDDDALTRKLLTRMLERLGCFVTTASDGQEALDLLLPTDGSRQPAYFDMISLDNSMPRMSGPEMVSALRQSGRTDFVCGATGNALISDQQAFLDKGANQVLAKPIMIRDLKQMLAFAADRKRQAEIAMPPS